MSGLEFSHVAFLKITISKLSKIRAYNASVNSGDTPFECENLLVLRLLRAERIAIAGFGWLVGIS